MSILAQGCICGHDHRTIRNEPVDLCIEHPCRCDGWTPRCQNCGEPASPVVLIGGFDVCSRRCALQIEHANALKVAA